MNFYKTLLKQLRDYVEYHDGVFQQPICTFAIIRRYRELKHFGELISSRIENKNAFEYKGKFLGILHHKTREKVIRQAISYLEKKV